MHIWQSYQQERGYLVHFVCLATTLLKDTIHLIVRNHARYSPIKKISGGLGNKSFIHVIWLLTIPPHLNHVTTVPRNLSLITTRPTLIGLQLSLFLTLMFHEVV